MGTKPRTLIHRLQYWAEQQPHEPALYRHVDGVWKHTTWQQYWHRARNLAKGLISLGIQPGECVAIVGDNRPGWVITQFAVMACRAVPAPIYATNTKEQAAYIVSHSKSRVIVCDKESQLHKLQAAQDAGLFDAPTYITMDAIEDAGESVLSLEDIEAKGAALEDTELDKRLAEVDEMEACLLIYTSGTTGVPKAVQLHNAGIASIVEAVVSRFSVFRDLPKSRGLSYLPLCHIAEQLFTNLLMMETGGEVWFCEDIKRAKDFLPTVKPTHFLGVPRVWEKMEAALKARIAEAPPLRAKLAGWAMRTEKSAFLKQVDAGGVVRHSLSRKIANKLVISKVKERLGFQNLVMACTGSAPLSRSTKEFFASLGVVIYEGYGMSETTGVACTTVWGEPHFDTVGKPLDGVEAMIAPDGELLLRGISMTMGYLHDEKKTKELLDEKGWLHTGDLGEILADGRIKITGRKKDILITAGGKNVAPAEMEAHMQSVLGIGQAVVVGDRKPYLTALITLDPESLDELCGKLGIDVQSIAELATNDKVKHYLDESIETACNAKVARYQTIKKFRVLPVEFTVDTGEVTPTLKVKRNVVHSKYEAAIDSMYE